LKYFFLVIGVFMSALFIFNAQMDVAGFRTGEVYPLAGQQTASQVMVSDRDYDQRSWVRARLESGCPETLLWGSSTLGTVSGEMLGAGDFLNGWLTGPTVEDLEAVAQMLIQGDCVPKNVILGVDPFFVNPKVESSRWRTVKALQRAFVGGASAFAWFDTVKSRWLRFTDLLAFQTTRDGVRLLRSGAGDAKGPHLVDDLTQFCAGTAHTQSVRHTDGHFSYCARWVKTPAAVAEIARTYVQRDVHRMRSWRAVSEPRLERLRAVVAHLTARGARVLLVAPTYHPLTYAALRADPVIADLLDTLDAALAQLAEAPGVSWRALRDPEPLGCPATAFFDSHHPDPRCAERVGAALAAALSE